MSVCFTPHRPILSHIYYNIYFKTLPLPGLDVFAQGVIQLHEAVVC